MKSAAKSMVDKGAEGGGVDAYVGRKALRKCGGIYVVSRRDGLVKVGITEGDFSRRFKELDQASRSAGIVGIQPEILVPLDEGMTEVESAVHEELSANREGGEWFRVSAEDAVNSVLSAVVRQRVRNAKHRQCIQAGAMEKRREDAGHPSCEEIIEAALFAAQSVYPAFARALTLATVAVAQAKTGSRKEAWKTFKTVLSIARSIDKPALLLSQIAGAQAEAGDIDSAFSTAQGISEWDQYRANALNSIARMHVKILAEAGNIAAALSIAQTIIDEYGEYGRHEAIRGIVLTQVKVGDIDGACATAQNIDCAETRAEALCDIALAKAKAGDIDGAYAIAQNIDSAHSRAGILCAIASAKAKMGDIDDALDTARGVGNADDRAVALGNVALAQAQAGNTQSAQDTFADALNVARSIDCVAARAWALRNIALALAKVGNAQSAQDTFADALNAARSIGNVNGRADALRNIALAQAKAGDIDGALDIAQSIDDHDRALHNIASAQAESGSFRGAMKTAVKIKDDRDRAKTLAGIARHLAAWERN